jgi:hypothetical protein
MGRQKVESPDGQAAGRDINNNGANAPAISLHTIAGGTNIIGTQGPVHVTVGVVRKAAVRHVINPGPEHLDASQRVKLQALHREWVALHGAMKQKALSPAAAWVRINQWGESSSYHLILSSQFDRVCAMVQREMAILRRMKSAPKKDPEWRTKRIAAIKVRCKKQLGDPDAYRPYIKKAFSADSLTDLSSEQLQRTYSYVMGKETTTAVRDSGIGS